ncbi:MAG: HEAT repeat domain-containing protein [Candidatus Hydrogenedentes bacterium]|nr:HEAT repeat domain-containing protein [Candidatus Hydrogenedentota bacterium]
MNGRMWNHKTLLLLAGLLALGFVAPLVSAQDASIDDTIKAIGSYAFGQTREPLCKVEDLVRNSLTNPEQRAVVEKGLLALLEDANTTDDCKDFVCRQLQFFGSDESVPVLAKMLTTEKYSDMARYALESKPGRLTDDAFLAALSQTSGRTQVGIINSLGVRGSADFVAALAGLLGSGDKAVSDATALAIGRIGGDAAIQALTNAEAQAPAELKVSIANGLVLCAQKLMTEGKNPEAIALCEKLVAETYPKPVRIAATKALISLQPETAVEKSLALLKDEDLGMRGVGSLALRKLEGTKVTTACADAVAGAAPEVQIILLAILKERADKAAMPAVVSAVGSADPEVKGAAVQTLATVGDASAIALLVETVNTSDGDLAKSARDSLDSLRGDGIDEAMMKAVDTGDPKTRVELVRSLAARNCTAARPFILKMTQYGDDSVRAAAFDALGVLSDGTTVPELAQLVVAMVGNSAQQSAENALVTVAQKIAMDQKPSAGILGVYQSLKERKAAAGARAALLRDMGRIGDPSVLDAIRAANDAKSEQVAEAALRALAEWPTPEVLGDLKKIISGTQDETKRALAFRGFARLLRVPSDRGVDATLALYDEGMKLAANADEKKQLLAGLGEVHDEKALALIEPLMADEALKAEAGLAAEKIKKAIQK